MSIVTPHPSWVGSLARMREQQQQVLAEQLEHGIERVYRIIRLLNSIASPEQCAELAPVIAGYQRIVDLLAGIDPRRPPDQAVICEFARDLAKLNKRIFEICVPVRSSRSETAAEALRPGDENETSETS